MGRSLSHSPQWCHNSGQGATESSTEIWHSRRYVKWQWTPLYWFSCKGTNEETQRNNIYPAHNTHNHQGQLKYKTGYSTKLAKLWNETGLKWTEALSIALTIMRSNPNQCTWLTPFEIVMGRPMKLPVSAPLLIKARNIHRMDEIILNYCIALTKSLWRFHAQVTEAQEEPTSESCHVHQPGMMCL